MATGETESESGLSGMIWYDRQWETDPAWSSYSSQEREEMLKRTITTIEEMKARWESLQSSAEQHKADLLQRLSQSDPTEEAELLRRVKEEEQRIKDCEGSVKHCQEDISAHQQQLGHEHEEMSKRKTPPPNDEKPLRKIRALSGYNVWHGEYLRSQGLASQSLASANKASSVLWKSMSEEERKRYKEEAKNRSANERQMNTKKECKKILTHLQEVSEHAEALNDCHVMYVVVQKGDHYVGGTDSGVHFLKNCGTYVPYSFMGYLSAKESGFLKGPSLAEKLADKDSLRKAVETLFNKLYGQYIHDDKARLPYSKVQEYGLKIEGLPTVLKHPSSYGKSTLKAILDNAENLKFYASKLPCFIKKNAPQSRCEGKVALPSAFLEKRSCEDLDVLLRPEFSVSSSYEAPIVLQSHPSEIVKPLSDAPLQHDHTYFRSERRSKKTRESKKKQVETAIIFNIGDKVMLTQRGKSVGIGTVAQGRTLHGCDIPDDYVKVIVDYIQPNIVSDFTIYFI